MNVSAASLTQQLVTFRSQALSLFTDSSFGSIFQSAANSSSVADSLAAGGGKGALSASGRNTTLFDPESAYNMMSVINQKDTDYKAQYSELSQMKTNVNSLASVAQDLTGISMSTANDTIRSKLQGFVDQYNAWDKRFDGDMQKGGVLADTQAAQVARWELDQSMENRFYGVDDGFNGLASIGITIDKATGQASLDNAKLDAALSSNRKGVVDVVDEFAANFAGAGNLLNSAGNFIPNQLNNLSSAIQYIESNISSWRSEFGTGDAAKSSGQVAQALAAYNQAAGAKA